MARFSSDLGAQRFPTRVDASKAAAAGAQSVAGAGTFLLPTPLRSPREGSAAPAGFRHRHSHSFSDFQESLDGAYDDSPRVPHPSTVAAASADAAATSGAVSALRLNAPPAAAARNSGPPTTAASAAASSSAVAAAVTSPTDMPPGRSRSHGSDTMARRRLTRHRRTQSVEAVMEYYGVTEQALTLNPTGTPMGQAQVSSVKRVTSTGQVRSVKQAASMTPSSSSPFPRVYRAVQSPHGLRRARSAGKQSLRDAATCFLKLPCSGPSPASSVSSPLKPLSVKQSPRDAAEFSLKSPCSRPSLPSSASSFPSKPLSVKQSPHDAAACALKSPCSSFSPPCPASSAFSSLSEPLSPPHLSTPPLSPPPLSPPPLSAPPLSAPPLSAPPLSPPPLSPPPLSPTPLSPPPLSPPPLSPPLSSQPLTLMHPSAGHEQE
ncbi:unnamed protein product [Closterium sp. NIES-64]|nr:unnamed protein product [Closterium sp. NIES-64]